MVTLSPPEAAALLRLLDDTIPQLRVEIHRTEWNRELRARLESDEATLGNLRQRLADHEAHAMPLAPLPATD